MTERYRDDLPEVEKKGWVLSNRVRDIARHNRIDGRLALERFVSESILWALRKVSSDPFMVKGGLLHDQRERETGDADVMYAERRSAVQLYGEIGEAAALLRQHGILWVPGEVQAMSMGGRGEGFRVPVVAKVGPSRVNTHLDVSFGAFPAGTVSREFRSMFKGPAFTAYAQPLEAQAADKFAAIAAIVTIGSTNTRLKDFADLHRLHGMGLDNEAVARHLHRTMRERKADMALLLQPVPDGLSFEYADAHRAAWKEMVARSDRDRGLPTDFSDLASDVRFWWADVQERLVDLAERDQLEPRRRIEAPSIQPDDRGVYDLAAYRKMRA